MGGLKGIRGTTERRVHHPWRDRRAVGLGVALMVYLTWALLRVLAKRSIAVQGLLAAPLAAPGVAGVPRQCGSDGRVTWTWMNPWNFNATRRGPTANRGKEGVFLVGCGHSGTTPTAAVLARHPRLWMYAPNEALEYSVKPNSFADVGWTPFLGAASLRDDARIRALARKRKPNATKWLVKSPSNVCRIGYILRALPAARILGLVRDGRDVMLSLLERYPTADPGGPLCLGRWVNDNTALLLYAPDPRLKVLKYEDLFLDPPRFPLLRAALVHLGLDPSFLPNMLEAQRRQGRALRGVVASDAHTRLRTNQTRRPFSRAPPRWPSQMTPKLKRVFKANHAALHLLAHFGYANASHSW